MALFRPETCSQVWYWVSYQRIGFADRAVKPDSFDLGLVFVIILYAFAWNCVLVLCLDLGYFTFRREERSVSV